MFCQLNNSGVHTIDSVLHDRDGSTFSEDNQRRIVLIIHQKISQILTHHSNLHYFLFYIQIHHGRQ